VLTLINFVGASCDELRSWFIVELARAILIYVGTLSSSLGSQPSIGGPGFVFMRPLTVCDNVIAIGTDAAANLVRGKNVIVIGKGIDTPATADDYINIGGELIISNGVVEKAPNAGVDLSKLIHSEVDDALRSVGVR
jgi:hypothetical protein